MLAWARFVARMVCAADALARQPWAALAHGAALVVLDGLALGAAVDAGRRRPCRSGA